jgi:hypothetical protein
VGRLAYRRARTDCARRVTALHEDEWHTAFSLARLAGRCGAVVAAVRCSFAAVEPVVPSNYSSVTAASAAAKFSCAACRAPIGGSDVCRGGRAVVDERASTAERAE